MNQPNQPTSVPTSGEEQVPVSELGFEQARDELILVVRTLEAGGQSLDDSLALWERGEELAARCEEHLDGARQRIDQVLQSKENAASGGEQAPFDN